MKTAGLFAALVLGVAFLSVKGAGEADKNMKAYPAAEEGMVRYVLQLPKEADESAMKVEIIAGKTVMVDDANRYFFPGKIEEKIIEGWGFPRYNVSQLGPMAGTLMATDPNAPKVSKFVPLGGDPYLVRYNSKLPLVIYAPKDVEVRYRVWTAAPKSTAVEKG